MYDPLRLLQNPTKFSQNSMGTQPSVQDPPMQ